MTPEERARALLWPDGASFDKAAAAIREAEAAAYRRGLEDAARELQVMADWTDTQSERLSFDHARDKIRALADKEST